MAGEKKHSWIDWAVATLPLPGETQSGDLYLVQPRQSGVLVAVVDGLGHGEEAAAAARIAVDVFKEHADESVIPLIKRCHQSLRRTRGVVATLAAFRVDDETLTWLGVGNVDAQLFHRDYDSTGPVVVSDSILLKGGVVGYHLPSLRAAVIPLVPGDFVVFSTDGIYNFFAQDLKLDESPQQIADHILAHHAKGTDDALVLVVKYLGNQEPVGEDLPRANG